MASKRKSKVRAELQIDKTDHIVVLDQSWHALFEGKKTPKIAMLESRLNKLLKEQGKVNTEYKAYKVLKKQMMEEIVQGMDEAFNKDNPEMAQKLQKNEKHIKEINKKFELYEKKKSELPSKIESVNQELLKESMFYCYERLIKNKEALTSLEAEIEVLHQKAKRMVGEKEDMDQEINRLYQFIHDIAGIDVIEQMDRMYFGEDK